MRPLILYLRSRQAGVTTAVALACVVALGLVARTADTPLGTLALALFAVAIAVSVAATSLAGADPALERTAAVAWWWRRAAHVVAIGVLACTVVAQDVPTAVVVRNVIGMTGLAALGATLLGGALAWCVPMVWTVVAVSASLASRTPGVPVVTWPVQPADTTVAFVAAVVLGVVGLAVYAVRGPRVQ